MDKQSITFGYHIGRGRKVKQAYAITMKMYAPVGSATAKKAKASDPNQLQLSLWSKPNE